MRCAQMGASMKIIHKRGCNICGCRECKKLFEQRFAYMENVTFIRGYDVVCCPKCGFIYADGIPVQSELNEYYSELSKYEIVQSALTDFLRTYYESSLAFIISTLAAEGKRLCELEFADIGCATGDFLIFLKEKGYTRLTGVDPSEKCVCYLKQQGIAGIQATIDKIPQGIKYGFLRLNTVLEHIEDLNGTIERLFEAVADGGYVYLAVPDILGFEKLENCPFQEFSVEHINYFSPSTLTFLMRKHGFEPVACREEGDDRFSELQAIYRKKTPAETKTVPDLDQGGLKAMSAYIEKNKRKEEVLNGRLEKLAESREPLVVWGAGTFTLRQLAAGELGRCNITCFVDRNEHYQGQTWHGIPVIKPEEVKNDMGAVFITAYYAQEGIGNYIRNQRKLSNVILKDYL